MCQDYVNDLSSSPPPHPHPHLAIYTDTLLVLTRITEETVIELDPCLKVHVSNLCISFQLILFYFYFCASILRQALCIAVDTY